MCCKVGRSGGECGPWRTRKPNVLFTGQSAVSIDAKQRLAIPAKHRNLWNPERDGDAWVCVPWSGGLRLYTEARFEALAGMIEESLTPGEDEAQLDADLFSLAERLEIDAQGRIVLPKLHLRLAGLGREVAGPDGVQRFETSPVVVIGARNRLEVRERDAWLAGQHERLARRAALIERIEARKGGQ